MRSRFIGGILLIVGTSIGAGMLALPVANAAVGFWPSFVSLVFCWFIMALGAFFILEVNLYLPPGKNMISMAAETLGTPGLLLAWFSYLFLLYALLAAYISGGADVFSGLIRSKAPSWMWPLLFTLTFGAIVYKGIRQVDMVNRWLMFTKLVIYGLLVILITPYVHIASLKEGNPMQITSTLMILITSFGFAIIVPNLRDYFNDDIPTLKKVIFIGSLIPLCCYLAWDWVIMGSITPAGDNGLIALMQSNHTTSALAAMITARIHNTAISSLFQLFTSVCMLTAFLGVSLCLISFLRDGLQMAAKGKQGFQVFLFTFSPPLALVIYYPGAYIHALNYAGFFCVILLLLLPAWMSYAGRHPDALFIVPGGKITQIGAILISLALIFIAI